MKDQKFGGEFTKGIILSGLSGDAVHQRIVCKLDESGPSIGTIEEELRALATGIRILVALNQL